MINIPLVSHVGNETLAGFILKNDSLTEKPRFIYVHGGGTGSCKERVYDIANPILTKNISILSFDMSGHGNSSGTLKNGMLKKRVLEAQTMIDLHATQPLILCGASMGGYVAIKLLELYTVDTLILMCPALYDQKAYSVPFDQGFTNIIRAHESWKNTDALQLLQKFTGNLLVIIGDRDEVIPAGIIDLIISHTPNVKKKELYLIPNCPHKIHDWIIDYPEELIKVQQKICEYII